jgi:hypothetical protein
MSEGVIRVIGVLAGLAATAPVGFFAWLALSWCPSCPSGVVLGGIAVALLISTVAVADGHAWGALAIGLYGAGMAIFYVVSTQGLPYATASDAAFPALHVAIAMLSLTVAIALVAARPGAADATADHTGQGA